MYFQQCSAKALVCLSAAREADLVMEAAVERLYRALAKHAEDAGVPDFRAEDCDVHTHADAATDGVEVAMVWNPQPGHIELLGGPSDGLEWVISDPDMDHVRVALPRHKRDHWLEPIRETPEPSVYSRWKINGNTRRWVYRFSDMNEG